MLKSVLVASVAVTALMLGATAAYAEDVAADAKADANEIIVTATKRAENVQDIAGTVDVLTATRLTDSGVKNLTSLESLTPGVHVQTQASAAFIYVRGVGAATLIGDPSVPLFIDGVYTGRGVGTGGLFLDLARVEVLKGPQGTLYGRNATAGAVNLVSNAPVDKFEGAVQVGYGNFDRYSGQAMLNLPVGETFAVRGAVQYIGDDGYLSNGSNKYDDLGAKLQAKWSPSEDVSLRILGDYYKKNGPGPSTVTLFSSAGGCVATNRFCRPSDPWFTSETQGSVDNENWGVAGELSWDLGPATFTITPAHRETDSDQVSFLNALTSGSRFLINTKQDTVEARFVSNSTKPFKWIVGGYYHHESTKLNQVINGIVAGPGLVLSAYTDVTGNKIESYAVFAEGTYSVTEALRLTGGLRYTDESRTQAGSGYIIFTAAPVPGPPRNIPLNAFDISGSVKNDKLTWKVGVEYDLSPTSLLYANAGTGFKSGGINRESPLRANGAPFDNTFDEETIRAYSVGSKNIFADGRVLLNLEAFLWDYDGRQNDQFAVLNSPPANAAQDIRTFNLGKTRIYGLDVSSAFEISDNDRIELGLAYLHARYRNDPANIFPATTAFGGFVIIEPGADLRGKVLAFSPKWSGTAAYQHRFDLGDSGSIRARAETQFQTVSFTQYRLAAQTRQPGYTKTSLSLTYTTADEQYSLTGYVRNLEDKAVIRSSSVAALTSPTPRYYGYIEEPRTYGVELRAKF